MLDRFEEWLKQVEEKAIKRKKDSAKDPLLWKKEVWPSPYKNSEIKNKFRDEMEQLENNGKQIYFSRPSYKAKTGEWLYDFVSSKYEYDEEGKRNLVEVFITMEIEVSNPKECDEKHDFNKLLQADSKYKIFIFQQKSKRKVLDSIEKLLKSASKYKFRCDSDFLLCGWSTTENKFYFDRFKASRVD